MWKKIHSNRNPQYTLYSEIRKEFSPYFSKAGGRTKRLVQQFPNLIFGFMVVLLTTSAILACTIFRHRESKTTVTFKAAAHPLNDGFDQILRAGAKLKETIRLKKIVDSISLKRTLSKSDSIGLVNALDSLRNIHSSLN